MFRSSTSSRSLTPKSAAVSASPTTFLLPTYGTRASRRCSRSVEVTALTLYPPLAFGAPLGVPLLVLPPAAAGPRRSFLAPQSRRHRAPLARSCQDSLEAGDDGFAQVGPGEDHRVRAARRRGVPEGYHASQPGRGPGPTP